MGELEEEGGRGGRGEERERGEGRGSVLVRERKGERGR